MTEPDRFGTAHWPIELKLKQAERRLEIAFDDGSVFSLPAEYLRVESPSAEVQGHNPQQKKLVSGCAAIGITQLEAVGNYAVRIIFDDRHDTGLYSWSYLYELGRDQPQRWQRYVEALSATGLSRGAGS
jgi:DUF971 family protein